MKTDFFDQFNVDKWSIPKQPSIDDPEWERRFEHASDKVKTNIANGWIWQLNEKLAKFSSNSDVTEEIVSVLNKQYKFLRNLLPYCSPELHRNAYFNGTVHHMVENRSGMSKNSKAELSEALVDLWFGDNEQQVPAVARMCKLAERNNTYWSGVNMIGQLVPSLAWDVVKQNPSNLQLHIDTAKLSYETGNTNLPIPTHDSAQNRAWFILGKVSRQTVGSFTAVYGENVLASIQNEPVAVSATLLPQLMKNIRNDGSKGPPYLSAIGLACSVPKLLPDITDYDILRLWIPSKTSVWDAAESLGIHFEEACKRVVDEALGFAIKPLALPEDVAVSSLFNQV